jgi:putative tail length tape measure protein
MADKQINVKINGTSAGAVQAIDRVGQKADEVLGKKLAELGEKMSKGLSIAGAAVGITAVATATKEAVKAGAELSDKYALIKARINMINDGTQSTAEIMDKVYAAAERTRGSYLDMAGAVGRLGILAKDAFSSNDETIAFVEQMNKQFKIGGASIEEQTSAMYQLTQAMAAGKLQGDEFRSIMENAPLLAQAISQEMGLPMGQLKEMSSQGLITADVIKNAMFNSADETNAKFAELPMTFAEVGNSIQNQAIQAFQPVLESLTQMTAGSEFKEALNGIGVVFQGLAAVARVAISGISGAFSWVTTAVRLNIQALQNFGSVLVAIGPPAVATFAGITTYMIASRIAAAAFTSTITVQGAAIATINAATKAWAVTTGAVRAVFLGIRTAIATTTAVMGAYRAGILILNAAQAANAVRTLAASGAMAVFNAVLAANPIGLVVAVLAVLVAALASSEIATNGFGATMKSIWMGIVHTVTWAINGILSMINALIRGINAVSGKIASVFNTSASKIDELNLIDAQAAEDFGNNTADMFGNIGDALNPSSGGEVGFDGAGAGGDYGTGSGGKGGSGGSSQKDAQNEAERLHRQILESWTEMFGTRAQLAEQWRDKELEELEKSKANNIHYEEDKQKIMEMYARKREDAMHEEAKRLRELQNSIRDMNVAFKFNTADRDSTGAQSPLTKLAKEQDDAVNSIKDKYQELSDKFAEMTERDRAAYIKMLQDTNTPYELVGNRLTFKERENAELIAMNENFENQRLDLIRTSAEEEWAIKEAMRTQNFEALQQALTDEYVATQQNYELRKQLLEEYQQAVMDSHFNSQQMFFDMANAGIDSMQEGISKLIQGTQSLEKAFQNIGNAILKTIADTVAKWIAAQLQQMIFGKMMASQTAAANNTALQAQLPLATQLAQQMAMATWGASATAGMAAWSAASATGAAMSSVASLAGRLGNIGGGFDIGSGPQKLVPNLKLASGGLAYGRTFAEIGEGNYPEAVVPLSEQVFGQIGEGISKAGGGGDVHVHVNAMDAQSFMGWLESSGGQTIRQFLVDNNREFTSTAGTW